MRRCKECNKFTQSNPCSSCGFDDGPADGGEPFDEISHRLRQRLNGCLAAIENYKILSTSNPENSSFKNMLLNLNDEKRRIERDCGSSLSKIRKTPDNLKCKITECNNIGSISGLGSTYWYCREHFQN